MDRKLIARKAFASGFNCCQSVMLAFSDDINIDKTTLLNLTAPFGAGFGRTRSICGAVSCMGMVSGLLSKNDEQDIKKDKDEAYKITQQLIAQFMDRNGTIVCKELLQNIKNLTSGWVSSDRTEEYYKVRPCIKFVEDSVEILEKYLLDNGLIDE